MGAGASSTATKIPQRELSRTPASRFSAETSAGEEYQVTLRDEIQGVPAGSALVLRIAYESLVLLDQRKVPQLHFPYQAIICWGSTKSIFQFRLFGSYFQRPAEQYIVVTLRTRLGAEVQQKVLRHVRALMVDMKHAAVHKEDFNAFSTMLQQQLRTGVDASSIMETISQFTEGRTLLAKQAVELLAVVGADHPFERVELCCALYEKILTKDSFQLLLNQFRDTMDRENIIHRLGLATSDVITASCPDGLGERAGFNVPLRIGNQSKSGRAAPPAAAAGSALSVSSSASTGGRTLSSNGSSVKDPIAAP